MKLTRLTTHFVHLHLNEGKTGSEHLSGLARGKNSTALTGT